MKRIIVVCISAILSVLALPSHSAPPRTGIDVATFTQPGWGHPSWEKLGETDQTAYWYAYGNDNDFGPYVLIKIATRTINGGYSVIDFMSGYIHCGPGKTYPVAVQKVSDMKWSAVTGFPLSPEVGGFGVEMPVTPGTVLAKVVIRSCDAMASANNNWAPRKPAIPLGTDEVLN